MKTKRPSSSLPASNEYALKAFTLLSLDYLLKPMQAADLARALEKHAYWLAQTTPQEQLLPMEEIAYFFTLNEVVYLVRHDGRKFPLEPKLEKLGAMLDPAVFFRLNRQ